ncbi:glycoside hydrolase family 75 protein [Ralstonia solanacearum]|uniref:glycoside hydrolase family 75 protein n=1 Tax=Ralstonia solanacearum TaxID=305 RepID=UPI0018AF5552|nr:glycoside hydrolase family 75 protein [Ralstonia solanacearum]
MMDTQVWVGMGPIYDLHSQGPYMHPLAFAFTVAALALTTHSNAETFQPPPASRETLSGIDLSGEPIAQSFKKDFDDCDQIPHHVRGKPQAQCMGRRKVLPKPGSNGQPTWVKDEKLPGVDPNNNTTLLKLANEAILFDAKMAVDADGSGYAKKQAKFPDSPETSLRYSDRTSLDADKVAYAVLPLGFPEATGLTLGDVAAIIYRDKITYAIIGDQSKAFRIGEGSIRLHEALGQNGCLRRDQTGVCTQPRGHSIPKDVIYLVFPGTRSALCPTTQAPIDHHKLCSEITPANINQRVAEVGKAAFEKLKRN